MTPRKILVPLALLFLMTSLVAYAATPSYTPRGRYVYDNSNMFSLESRAMVSQTLLHIDVTTNYEFVIVTSNNSMSSEQMIKWFNDNGVGKKGLDNGAVLFIFPNSHEYYVSIGSGNDVITASQTASLGAKALSGLSTDPSFAVISYLHIFDNQFEKMVLPIDRPYTISNIVIDNGYLISMWGFVLMVLMLLISEIVLGVEKQDLYVPLIIALILGGLFGFSLYGINQQNDTSTTTTYGIITTTAHHASTHTTLVSCGKNCWTTVTHYDYYNDVTLIGYDLKHYTYQYYSEDDGGNWAYGHVVGLVQLLTYPTYDKSSPISATSTGGVSDNSGGVTVGAGVSGKY